VLASPGDPWPRARYNQSRSRNPQAFSTPDVELLQQVAAQVAIALENALAFKEIDALKDKLASKSSTWKKRFAPNSILRRSSATAPPCAAP